jgi:hypothetical protein
MDVRAQQRCALLNLLLLTCSSVETVIISIRSIDKNVICNNRAFAFLLLRTRYNAVYVIDYG